jgi:hypothetical protein
MQADIICQRWLPWVKEFKPKAYEEFLVAQYEDSCAEIEDKCPGDKWWEVNLNGWTTLVFQSARGDKETTAFSWWDENAAEWKHMSLEASEILKHLYKE